MTKIIDDLNDYTKEELLAYAEQFGTEVRATISKKDLVTRLEEDGISVEFIAGYAVAEEEEPTPEELGLHPAAPGELAQTAKPTVVEEDDDPVLVKMTRRNGTYEVRGYRFTAEHPFALVKEDDADYLIETVTGFRMASPKEAREFYS